MTTLKSYIVYKETTLKISKHIIFEEWLLPPTEETFFNDNMWFRSLNTLPLKSLAMPKMAKKNVKLSLIETNRFALKYGGSLAVFIEVFVQHHINICA